MPSKDEFAFAADTDVTNSFYVEVPDTTAYPSGGIYNETSTGSVGITLVEEGRLIWRPLADVPVDWYSAYAAGWLSNNTAGMMSANLSSIPRGDALLRNVTNNVTMTAIFMRGPANLAAASCQPGSAIDNILLPRYGNESANCNSTNSYRWGERLHLQRRRQLLQQRRTRVAVWSRIIAGLSS